MCILLVLALQRSLLPLEKGAWHKEIRLPMMRCVLDLLGITHDCNICGMTFLSKALERYLLWNNPPVHCKDLSLKSV